ncbi:MAG: cytochrome c peroxidase [Parashewanella sp.]
MLAPLEMNFTLHELEYRLRKGKQYRLMFAQAFGDNKINAERISKAIATY